MGDFTAVNLEAIMALNRFRHHDERYRQPRRRFSQADLRDALVGAGIPVPTTSRVTTFDDYERLMRTFTDITGRADL